MSMNQTNSQDEMDLTDVFTLLRRWFYQFMALGFRAIDFLLKFWWAALILIIGGAILGFFSMGEPTYKATLIVQTNFKTQPYVYNAVEQFNLNVKENDTAFVESLGLNIDDLRISDAMLVPVIDVVGLLGNIERGDRNLETVIGELEVHKDEELFATDRFYSSYTYHKLSLELTEKGGQKEIDALMDYINNRPLIKAISTESKKNRIEHIARNEKTLEQMDAVVEAFVVTNEVANKNSGSMSFYNNSSNVDLRQLFLQKAELVLETEELKNELVSLDDAAVIVSDVQTSLDEGITDKKYIVYPVVFIFLFMLIAGIISGYRSMRKTLKEEQFLD